MLPYTIDPYLFNCQYINWEKAEDNEHVAKEILTAILGKLPDKEPVRMVSQAVVGDLQSEMVISEDGR